MASLVIPHLLKLLPALALPLLAQAEGLLAIDNPASHGSANKAYAQFEAFAGNDQVAMREYGGDWNGSYTPRSGVNLGLAVLRAESGVQWSGYRLGALWRGEALVQANRDTSDLVQQYKTSAGYTPSRTYALDYQLKGFEADGARLSKSFHTEGFGVWRADWGLGLSYLRGQRITLNAVNGAVVTLNTKDFNATAQQAVSDNQINTADLGSFNAPYGRQASVSGSGYAVDVGMALKHPANGARVELAVADLLGAIDWRNLPTNVSRYTTATKYYDANGYLNIYPAFTRASTYQNLQQVLDPKWLASLSYPLGAMELSGLASYTQGYWFPQVGVGYALRDTWHVKVDYDLRFGTVGLSLTHPWFAVSLRTDNLNTDLAKAYGLAASISIPF
jgi:hypothetical protein